VRSIRRLASKPILLAGVGLLALTGCSAGVETVVAPTTTAAPPTTTVAPEFPNAAPGAFAAGCVEKAPAGASSEARAYLEAANQAYTGWDAVTRSLESEGELVSTGDLLAQAATDRGFLASLHKIHFTGVAASDAAEFVSVVQRYDVILMKLSRHPAPLDGTQVPTLDNLRAAASSQLRAELGLRQSSCVVLRP
jgi:hypothetical protein